MTDYSRLIESSGPETDDADFARRALKIGLVVRDTDAWILDAPSGRWFHYNGLRLSPLGGWDSRRPRMAMALKPETQGSVLQKMKDAINEWRGLPTTKCAKLLRTRSAT